MRWSVSVIAEGDREVTRAEVVELADAVASAGGIASGIGATHYGAQLVIEADDRDTAVRRATDELVRAAEQAGLPPWPVSYIDAISEADDAGDLE